jgi:dihydroxyacetone kinase DhaKLM complex PTS-EIIA-like component DhaM
MSMLLENPLPIAVVGALAAVLAGIVFMARKSLGSLAALVGALVVTLALLAVERFVVTDREEVENSLLGVMAAIRANDAPGLLAFIDLGAAKVRADAESLMPQMRIEVANAASVETTLDPAPLPTTATSRFRAFLHGTHERSGTPIAYVNQQVDLQWAKRGDRWVITGYTAYFDGQPIDAVSSAAGNRPVP